jgi:hypothetical protein
MKCRAGGAAGPVRRRGNDQDGIFVGVVEQMRRGDAGEHAAQHAAEGRPQIELGQSARCRPQPIGLAMASQRDQCECGEIQEDIGKPICLAAAEHADRQRRQHVRQQAQHQRLRNPWPVAKHRDEGQEIERQRHHPQKRRRREIGGDERGHRDAQTRRNGGQQRPRNALPPCRALAFRHRVDECRSSGGEAGGGADAKREQREAERPQQGLRAERENRLDRQRIGEQRAERAQIGCGIEDVGVLRLRVAGGDEPMLQQRRGRRQCDEGNADRKCKQPDKPEHHMIVRRHTEARGNAQRQRQRDQREESEMQHRGLGRLEKPGDQVRIGVSGEQEGLERHHGDRPDRRRAAKPWQHHLGKHRLNGEQQQRRDEQRRGIKRRRGAPAQPRALCGGQRGWRVE